MGFVRSLQISLFTASLAPWWRKGAAVLDVNCGDGRFLPALLQHGCNVEATEPTPALREQAQAEAAGRVDIAAANGDSLPYADNYFDYAVLHLTSVDAQHLAACVAEMARVAERGIAVTFWNSASLGGLGNFAGQAAASLPWWQVRGALKNLGQGRYAAAGTLCLPPATWREGSPLAGANTLCTCLPVGAWMVAWLDLKPRQTGTPLTLRVPFLRSGETAMNP